MTTKTKILSLDGGTHGFNWLFCLREVDRDNPGFLSQADVLVGSSFGGFCAVYLSRHLGSIAKGESALEIIDGCIGGAVSGIDNPHPYNLINDDLI